MRFPYGHASAKKQNENSFKHIHSGNEYRPEVDGEEFLIDLLIHANSANNTLQFFKKLNHFSKTTVSAVAPFFLSNSTVSWTIISGPHT